MPKKTLTIPTTLANAIALTLAPQGVLKAAAKMEHEKKKAELLAQLNTEIKNNNKRDPGPDYASVKGLNLEAWDMWMEDRRVRGLPRYKSLREAKALAQLPMDNQFECVNHSLDRYIGLFPKNFMRKNQLAPVTHTARVTIGSPIKHIPKMTQEQARPHLDKARESLKNGKSRRIR